jgi:dihydrofolate synthase/folylpolyglutamate synthase
MPQSVWRAIETLDCRALTAGRDFHGRLRAPEAAGETAVRWDYESASCRLAALPAPALPGAIQYANAATALTALLQLPVPGACDRERVGAALSALRLPGRFQIARVAGHEWILDVAHNEPAAQVLAAELGARAQTGRTLAVAGILADKDAAAIARALDAQVDRWVLAGISGEARGQSAEALAARLPALRSVPMLQPDVAQACACAQRLARPGDRIVVLGSFHVVGPALDWLGLY